jgi:hypothetical protein
MPVISAPLRSPSRRRTEAFGTHGVTLRHGVGANRLSATLRRNMSHDAPGFPHDTRLHPAATTSAPSRTTPTRGSIPVEGGGAFCTHRRGTPAERSMLAIQLADAWQQDSTTAARCGEWSLLRLRRADRRENGARGSGRDAHVGAMAGTGLILCNRQHAVASSEGHGLSNARNNTCEQGS